MTVDDIKSLHARLLNPQQMVVGVFGDYEPDKALDLVNRLFGNLQPPANAAKISFDRNNKIDRVITGHKRIQKPTSVIVMGYPGPSIREEKDYTAMMILDTIMSGYDYPGGWLHDELRGEGLVYGVHALQLTGPAPGFFIVIAQTRPDAEKEVVSRILKNIDKAKRGEIDEEEFLRAKELVIAYHAQKNTTMEEQAQQAVLDELYGLGFDYDKGFENRVQSISLDDVKQVAQKYFGNYVLATVSPMESLTVDEPNQKGR
jgi:zinc protease